MHFSIVYKKSVFIYFIGLFSDSRWFISLYWVWAGLNFSCCFYSVYFQFRLLYLCHCASYTSQASNREISWTLSSLSSNASFDHNKRCFSKSFSVSSNSWLRFFFCIHFAKPVHIYRCTIQSTCWLRVCYYIILHYSLLIIECNFLYWASLFILG